ncbi:hypothetical protein FF011L_06180 [Roseimaritima multifibrata]|uniref:Uncharacterized protein n=1 Tax=Roseimaritima multifibrata TaxID=1930274 RepID=A0A517MAH1_9BACT|nr:hypothetical protein [Roseimaritima multifibrata]QDS91882.1 hypothetical protein FF011L_06180 [Roseimaritima multifibrata]
MAKRRPERLKEIAVPATFVPRFWEMIDGRTGIAKEVRHRYQTLADDTGADSYQKELLCQRAVFMSVQLETMECTAAETGAFDHGVYTQMSNALLGLLRTLGLERVIKDTTDLQTYLAERQA